MSATAPAQVRLLTSRTSPGLADIWRYRALIGRLVLRDLTVKYQRSTLGFLWTLLNPLLTVIVLVAVFSFVLRLNIESYWAFLISGYFAWSYVSGGLSKAGYVLREHAELSQSVAFPNQVLVLSASISKLVEYLAEMSLVLAALAIFYHREVPLSWVLFPLLVVLQWVMTVGLMYPLAILSALFQDVQHALPVVIITLFYASPVFYPAERIPEAARGIYFLNPLAGLLTMFHVVLYEGAFPSPRMLAAVAAVAAGVGIVGYWIFKRYQGVCVEIV